MNKSDFLGNKVNSNYLVRQTEKLKPINQKNLIFFNTYFDKGQVKELVSWFLKNYGEKRTINFLEQLKFIGFHQATLAGISLGIDDLQIPREKVNLITDAHIALHKIEQQNASGSLTSVEKSQCLIDTWNQTSDLLRQNAIQNFRNRNIVNPVYMMAFSGARGNVSQVRQLVAMRGLMADPQGAILEFPIQSNFREGLTITEYLISCYGARKGLVDTALRTATSGYLTRRLVDAAQHAVVSIVDCRTTRFNLISGKNLSTRLVGRVLAQAIIINETKILAKNHIIDSNDALILSKKENGIPVRSPLTCEATTSICQFCYGWDLASGKLVQIGEAVGVIAAQSIGEPGTQLTMRTFHTGGVGVFSDQALKPILANSRGQIIFENRIAGHFIRTPHGKIVYMIKYIPENPNRIFFRLKSFDKMQRDIIVREQDLPSGSLLFIKNGEYVHPKKLLAQASYLKVTKQKLPESSHPVYSPLDGQIFFESMNLFIEKELSFEIPNTTPPLFNKNFELKNNFTDLKNFELPDMRKMAKIGSFWILSSLNQYEYNKTTDCVKTGDLVSPNTILSKYEFYTLFRNQIQFVNSKLTFGRNKIQIPVHNMGFLKNNYYIQSSSSSHPKLKTCHKMVYYKDHFKQTLLWQAPISSNSFSFAFKHILAIYIKNLSSSPTFKWTNYPKGLIFSTRNILNQNISANENYLKSSSFTQKLVTGSSILSPITKFTFGILFLQKLLERNPKKQLPLSVDKTNFTKNSLLNSGWCFLGFKSNSNFRRQFLPIGYSVNKLTFPKENVSAIKLKRIKFKYWINCNVTREQHTKKIFRTSWYMKEKFTSLTDNFLPKILVKGYSQPNFILSLKNENEFNLNDINFQVFNTKIEKTKIQFQKTSLNLGLIWYCRKNKKQAPSILINQNFPTWRGYYLKKTNPLYLKSSGILFAQSLKENSICEKRTLKKHWATFSGKFTIKNPKNFLFSKQYSSINCNENVLKYVSQNKSPSKFQFFLAQNSGYLKSILTIKYTFLKDIVLPNIFPTYKILSNTLDRGLNIYQYKTTNFPLRAKFAIQTYLNNWIIPIQFFSIGLNKLKTSGELKFKNSKPSGNFTSTIRTIDLLTIQIKQPKFLVLGTLIRWGEEFEPGYGADYNGQVIKKNQNTLTLHVGVPILASANGIVHVGHNDLVQKNQLVITLKSQRLQTEDIVQGIPKIEQLFEARESQAGQILFDTVHIRLRQAFLRELKQLTVNENHWSIAVEKSFLEAQQFLVENVIDAYGNQGVKISEKHVEVIVRQMTSRVRILESGETGLLPGELVQHIWIQKFNKHIRQLGLREATYEPIVLGISKSVLQSESFLLAASFQEVSRVLVRSALSKKRDFLRGLHENVIVGQLIPAGTGLMQPLKNLEL